MPGERCQRQSDCLNERKSGAARIGNRRRWGEASSRTSVAREGLGGAAPESRRVSTRFIVRTEVDFGVGGSAPHRLSEA